MSKEEQNIVSRRCWKHPATGQIWIGDSSMDTLPPHGDEDKPCYIYELVDPRNMGIFYVGITVDLYVRFKQHIRGDGDNPRKDARVREILSDGHLIIMRTIEKTVVSDAYRRENWWIDHYRRQGIRLLNLIVPRRHKINPHLQPKRSHQTKTSRGRERTFTDVIGMLVYVRETGEWPDEVSDQMRRHYLRTYPEFFQKGRKAAQKRREQIQKADRIKAERK